MTRTILILTANPKDTLRPRLDQEVREISEGLQRAQKRDEFTLRQCWAARPLDVRRGMLDHKPNIVHFCGHGEREEGIAFEDEKGGTKLVSADALSGFFRLFSGTVQCVLLNACYSAIQAEAIAQHIPYVIGMKRGIRNEAAIQFSVAFYDALGVGESIEFAFRLACNAIQWLDLPDHLTPILMCKTHGVPVTGQFQETLHVAALRQAALFHLRPSAAPEGYRAVESLDAPGIAMYYRAKDHQIATLVPGPGQAFTLIDRYAITCEQLCACLNDLTQDGQASTSCTAGPKSEAIWRCEAFGEVLAVEAPGFWRANANSQIPWYCAGEPWGIYYNQEKGWAPLLGSELLPATLVTWRGADIYGLWAHDSLPGEEGAFLPFEIEWMSAARPATLRSTTTVPLNYAGYWARRELLNLEEVRMHWMNQPNVYRRTHPLPVAGFAEAASGCGGVQFLGNVWEWCADSRRDSQRVLKGGCCYSPREHCTVEYRTLAIPDRQDPYIGFRCASRAKGAECRH